MHFLRLVAAAAQSLGVSVSRDRDGKIQANGPYCATGAAAVGRPDLARLSA